ncbi:MAG: hypothetical protein K6T33_06680 [Thermomonas hydrothermalis]|uniref:hypothetical protein n=1 Tax=Thermomonas hydrothermalis TaxID=213588 RepID=UPI002357FECF|nr:hypothetical protein [Thermomonas hydrothermalis]MCL6619460.1 hypothetical protein [Thermomonas hydrothermalis]
MHISHWRRLGLAGALALLCSVVAATDIRLPDHYEFDATLAVPFQARAGQFPIRIDFDYPAAGAHTQCEVSSDVRLVCDVAWRRESHCVARG